MCGTSLPFDVECLRGCGESMLLTAPSPALRRRVKLGCLLRQTIHTEWSRENEVGSPSGHGWVAKAIS